MVRILTGCIGDGMILLPDAELELSPDTEKLLVTIGRATPCRPGAARDLAAVADVPNTKRRRRSK